MYLPRLVGHAAVVSSQALALVDSEGGQLSQNIVVLIAVHMQVGVVLELLNDAKLRVHVLVLAARFHDLADGSLALTDSLDGLSLNLGDLELFRGNQLV